MKKLFPPFLLILLITPLISFAQEKTVLLIESYHAEYPWDASYKAGLQDVLSDQYPLVCFEMDTKRLPKSEHEKSAQMAWDKYTKVRPALVILGDDNALKYLAPKFLETNIPVVYLGINRNPGDYGIPPKANITGVLERPLLKRSVASLKTILQPSPQKILVLFDDGTTSQSSAAEAFKGRTTLPIHNIMVQLKLIGKLDAWEKAVLNAKKEGFDAIVIGLYHTLTDKNGKHADAEELLKWTVKNTPVPPFAFWDFTVGPDKAIGGFVLFGRTQGEAAGKMALKILSGTPPGKIRPKIPEMGRFFFSRSQLKKWGLDLPPNMAAKAAYTE